MQPSSAAPPGPAQGGAEQPTHPSHSAQGEPQPTGDAQQAPQAATSQAATSQAATSQAATSQAATSQAATSQAATSQAGTSQAGTSQSKGGASQSGTSQSTGTKKWTDWADIAQDEDDEDEGTGEEGAGLTRTDEDGNRVVTLYYREADGRQMKMSRVLKVSRQVVKVNTAIKERQAAWKPFGVAAIDAARWEMKRAAGEEGKRQGPLVADTTLQQPMRGTAANIDDLTKVPTITPPTVEAPKRLLNDLQNLFSIVADVNNPKRAVDFLREHEKATAAAAAALAELSQRPQDGPSMGGGYGAMGGGQRYGQQNMRDSDDRTIRISNLPEFVTSGEIQILCNRAATAGSVVREYLVHNKETNVSRGFAFVSFATRGDAEQALRGLNGAGFRGAVLRVEWANNRQQRPPVAAG